MNTLTAEIEHRRHRIRTDAYTMSIGELVNMYTSGDLEIHPAFQRDFRWSLLQKTRLIESILLEIPIPPIFVAQRQDRVWEVIDGSQRLSTLLQFTGCLKKPDGGFHEPLTLGLTEYLPALNGASWDTIGQDHQRFIKRTRLDIKILLRDSDAAAKFELFQRLNTGGSQLSAQELRNCALVAINPDFFEWLNRLSHMPVYQACLELSDMAQEQKYDQELLLRFLAVSQATPQTLKGVDDIADWLTQNACHWAQDKQWDYDAMETRFIAAFDAMFAACGSGLFRRYDATKARFMGNFSLSAFDVMAAIADKLPQWSAKKLAGKVQGLWRQADFSQLTQTSNPARRLSQLIAYSRQQLAR